MHVFYFSTFYYFSMSIYARAYLNRDLGASAARLCLLLSNLLRNEMIRTLCHLKTLHC